VTLPDISNMSTDNLCFYAGCVLLLLGLFAPKKFVGVVVDWSPATSAIAVLLGLGLILGSYPQLRFWKTNTVNVDDGAIVQLKATLTRARATAMAAHDNTSDNNTCSNHGGEAARMIDDALKQIDGISPKKS
jgi:hypothetical protein